MASTPHPATGSSPHGAWVGHGRPDDDSDVEERTIAGSWYGTFLPQRDWPLIVGWLESGELMLDQMIERIELDRINEAFDRIRSNEAARQVIVF